jgi:hypothetical protein
VNCVIGYFVFPLIIPYGTPSYLEKVLYPQNYRLGMKVPAFDFVTTEAEPPGYAAPVNAMINFP